MKEDIEDFIKRNRESFDDEKPSNSVWSKIEGEVFHEKKTISIQWSYFWKVAAVVFFVFSGYLLWQLNDMKSENYAVEDNADEILEEFTTTETFYENEIATMVSAIEEYNMSDTSLTNSFKNDIDALDQQYDALKIELNDDKNEQVINALILNLQLRMEILNKQLTILDNLKNTESNENVNI
jgi:hypothetical protein